jgi:chromosome segregation ATPase
MSDELDELKESAERARESKQLAPVSLTMAIVAVLVATTTLLGHRAHTEELLLQTRATDQWSYYQAKNMRRNNLEALDELLTAMGNTNADRTAEVRKHFHEEIDKYREQQTEIQGEARSLEAEVQTTSSRANRFDLGEVLLEIALVVTSITLLTDKRGFWYFGCVLAGLGVICTVSGLFMH